MSSKFLKSKSLCPLPFTGAIVNTDGSVQCCSISKEHLGNVNERSLKEILSTSEKLKEIRREMLQNKFQEIAKTVMSKNNITQTRILRI